MALDHLLYVIADLEPEHLAHRLFPGVVRPAAHAVRARRRRG